MATRKHPKPDPELVQFTGGSASIVQSHTLGLQEQNRDNNAEENLTEDEEDYDVEDDDVEEIDMMHVDHDPMDNEVSARKGAEFRERLMNEVNRPYCEEECNRLDLAKQIDAAGDNLPKRGFFFWLTDEQVSHIACKNMKLKL
ncbi:unnamed protein product [Vicia faba]|uniref:Uncharacterized protein n=1 Tax=Vicia faba TaxID=3906 RepID=A0AAV1ACB2_VICFA|nr:unnamed protein product [Vicia faba]